MAKLGYSVVAFTGKKSQYDYLKSLGAATIISREEANDLSDKALLKERWSGVIDTVGGNTLATIIKSTKYAGCIAACGLVGGAEVNTNVYPFILRGVRLIGIDSVQYPISGRLKIWKKLAAEWKINDLNNMAKPVNLTGIPAQISTILRGEIVGRVLVVHQDE